VQIYEKIKHKISRNQSRKIYLLIKNRKELLKSYAQGINKYDQMDSACTNRCLCNIHGTAAAAGQIRKYSYIQILNWREY